MNQDKSHCQVCGRDPGCTGFQIQFPAFEEDSGQWKLLVDTTWVALRVGKAKSARNSAAGGRLNQSPGVLNDKRTINTR